MYTKKEVYENISKELELARKNKTSITCFTFCHNYLGETIFYKRTKCFTFIRIVDRHGAETRKRIRESRKDFENRIEDCCIEAKYNNKFIMKEKGFYRMFDSIVSFN